MAAREDSPRGAVGIAECRRCPDRSHARRPMPTASFPRAETCSPATFPAPRPVTTTCRTASIWLRRRLPLGCAGMRPPWQETNETSSAEPILPPATYALASRTRSHKGNNSALRQPGHRVDSISAMPWRPSHARNSGWRGKHSKTGSRGPLRRGTSSSGRPYGYGRLWSFDRPRRPWHANAAAYNPRPDHPRRRSPSWRQGGQIFC
jgi:hypothetical protein